MPGIVRFTLLIGAFVMMLSGCEKMDEKHKLTIEDRLVYSFRAEDAATREDVSHIIEAVRKKDYRQALNGLTLLSNTRKVSKIQKKAINDLIRQLRFDMEDEEINNKGGSGHE